MFKKKCPFCFEEVKEYWNEQKTQYIIECQECHKNGITIRVSHESPEKAAKLWNTRKFDDLLLSEPDFLLKSIQQFNHDFDMFLSGNLKHSKKVLSNDNKLKNIILDLNRIDYGYLIMPNLDIIRCQDSHPEEILNYLGIDTGVENPHINEEAYIRLGIIRVCNHANCLMVVLPRTYTKKQIDLVIEILGDNNFTNITSFCIYKEINDEKQVITFKTLSEIYLYLDEMKYGKK